MILMLLDVGGGSVGGRSERGRSGEAEATCRPGAESSKAAPSASSSVLHDHIIKQAGTGGELRDTHGPGSGAQREERRRLEHRKGTRATDAHV